MGYYLVVKSKIYLTTILMFLGAPHRCEGKCHEGPCPSCDKNSKAVCRCGRKSIKVTCKEYLRYTGMQYLSMSFPEYNLRQWIFL